MKIATDLKPIVARVSPVVFIAVFGWRISESIRESHSHPAVDEMLNEIKELSVYVPIADVEDSKELFIGFESPSIHEMRGKPKT